MKFLTKNSSERGQATLEAAMLVLGFTVILLGIFFICGASIADNEALLDARYHAERLAHDQNSDNGGIDGKEIKTWSYAEIDPFNRQDQILIPFTRADHSSNSGGSITSGFPGQFTTRQYSEPPQHRVSANTYFYDYEWKNLDTMNAPSAKSDFTMEVGDGTALTAAHLVQGTPNGGADNGLLDANDQAGTHSSSDALPRMKQSFFYFFGVHVSELDMENNPTNHVYMPKISKP